MLVRFSCLLSQIERNTARKAQLNLRFGAFLEICFIINVGGINNSNLNAYLSFGVEMNELAKYGLQYSNQSPLPNVQYQFLQWSLDSKFILVYYSFADIDKKLHEGYFWYDCKDGSIKNPLEM